MNVFLVSSPVQLLGAIEARRAYELDPSTCELVVTVRQRGANAEQIQALTDASWSSVCELDLTTSRSWFRSATALRRSLRGRIVDRAFSGYTWCPLAREVLARSIEIPVQIDDGTDTIFVAAVREGRLPEPEIPWSTKLARAVAGLRDHAPRALEFFTVFAIEPTGLDRVRANRFDDWRERNGGASASRTSEDWFLGAPFAEYAICRESDYLDELEQIAARVRTPLRYIPHRSEEPTRVATRAAALGTTPLPLDHPVEVEIVRGPRPRALHALMSSALPVCRAMFGDELGVHAHLPSSEFWCAPVREIWSIAADGIARTPGLHVHRREESSTTENGAQVRDPVDKVEASA